jgi:hypothetical protein
MRCVRSPALLCPFSAAIHPQIDEIERDALARWIRWMGFDERGRSAGKFEGSRFAALLGRCHPTASAEDLHLIVDFVVWLFLWDDQHDHPIGRQPQA